MKMRWMAGCVLLVCSVALIPAHQATVAASGQDKPAPPSASAEPSAQLRVSVVISRYQGDKKIGSLPYVLNVTTSAPTTQLRMGSEVPIVSRPPKDGIGVPAVNYRNVGTQIDCSATRESTGSFRLLLTVEDSSVHLAPGEKPPSAPGTNDYPSFRTFHTRFTALLRDGQTIQHTSATDPVTGEVMRVEVTANVIK